jgi:hypothetical protein
MKVIIWIEEKHAINFMSLIDSGVPVGYALTEPSWHGRVGKYISIMIDRDTYQRLKDIHATVNGREATL